jgi:cell division protein FtsQ
MKLWLTTLWQNPRVLNTLAVLCLGAALLTGTTAGVYWLKRHSLFNIKEVVVTGMRGEQDLAHQNPAFIRQAIVRQLRGNLLTVQLDSVQNAFAQAPWVRHVSVRRVWPNRLWVVLEEHQAVATLNEDWLVNQQGEAYMAVADDTLGQLPALVGDKQDASLILERLNQINEWLAPSPHRAVRLVLSDRRAWTAQLSNHMLLELGRDDLLPSAQDRVQRWVRTWPTAQQTANPNAASSPAVTGKIDLRYPNGYAVARAAL